METRVILIDMPARVKGTSVQVFDDGEDYITVVLNSRLNHEQQLDAYRHEQLHDEAGDFDTEMSADALEYTRHGCQD